MILTLDVGNTNIVLGGFEEDKLCFTSRLDTVVSRMADQYAILIKNILELNGYGYDCIDGCVISSVVSPVTPQLEKGVAKMCGVKPLIVSPGIKTGLNIKIDDPSILGSDLACAAVAAKERCKMPCIFVDMGTCIKIFVLDKDGSLLGGSISPGINLSFDSMSAKTAALPLIGAEPVDKFIGTNTVDSMRAGVIVGTACMVDGMIDKYEALLGSDASIIATGGFAPLIVPMCKRQIELAPDLVLEGLHIIYRKNKKDRK